jgi:alpha-ribazole phosphatase
MEIFLIRHTQPNVEKGICYGQTDLDVNDSFIEEVEQIQAKIQEFDFKNLQVYSSPLQRCSKLAEALFPSSFKVDKRLMELNFGMWEMKKWDEIPKEESQYWFEDWVTQMTPNGESYEDLYERCVDFWQEMQLKNFDKICVVSHEGFIRASHSYFRKISLKDSFDLQVGYGEVIKILPIT